jgi:beta-galactosidase
MTLTDSSGAGLSVAGDPVADVIARRWTSEDLDAARHPVDLWPGDRIWLNIDHAQNSLGTGSCGPGVLPAYRLHAAPATFTVILRPLTG